MMRYIRPPSLLGDKTGIKKQLLTTNALTDRHHCFDSGNASTHRHHYFDFGNVSTDRHHCFYSGVIPTDRHHCFDSGNASTHRHHCFDFGNVSTDRDHCFYSGVIPTDSHHCFESGNIPKDRVRTYFLHLYDSLMISMKFSRHKVKDLLKGKYFIGRMPLLTPNHKV